MVGWIFWLLKFPFLAVGWIFVKLIKPPLLLISSPLFLWVVPVALFVAIVVFIVRRVRSQGFRYLVRNLEEILCFPFLGTMAYLVFIQVYFRYILNDPIIWAEEITLLSFHWVVFLGAALGYKHGEKLAMETFVGQLSVYLQRKIYFIIEILIFLTLLLLIYHGVTVAILEWTYPSPALEFPQTYQSAGPVRHCRP